LINRPLPRFATVHAAVVLWVVLTAVTTAISRMHIEDVLPPHTDAPLPSHYMTMALVGWAGLSGLALTSDERQSSWPALATATFVAFALIPSQIPYTNWWVQYFRENDRIGQKIESETLSPPEAAHLTDRPDELKRLTDYLRNRRLAGFQ
jgi:hypothetical protein